MAEDVSFVQNALRIDHYDALRLHNWRLDLRRGLEAVELQMLAMREEELAEDSLWWLAQLGGNVTGGAAANGGFASIILA